MSDFVIASSTDWMASLSKSHSSYSRGIQLFKWCKNQVFLEFRLVAIVMMRVLLYSFFFFMVTHALSTSKDIKKEGTKKHPKTKHSARNRVFHSILPCWFQLTTSSNNSTVSFTGSKWGIQWAKQNLASFISFILSFILSFIFPLTSLHIHIPHPLGDLISDQKVSWLLLGLNVEACLIRQTEILMHMDGGDE